MLGNVFEWVEDCWHESYEGAPVDGSAWLDGANGDCGRRVLRGGAWLYRPTDVRSALRTWTTAGNRGNFIGFRLAQDIN
jgi:formylglycine-generating enzyme required for sulfatase activity